MKWASAAAMAVGGCVQHLCSAMKMDQKVASSSPTHFHEDLLLRNVHPFGIVFADPEAIPDQVTGSHGAFCATGEYGALEYWERVRQDNHVFFYCKARHTSQWLPPCVHLMPDDGMDDDDPRRFPFPMSVEQLDLFGAVKRQHHTSGCGGDDQADVFDSGATADSDGDTNDAVSLETYEQHIRDHFFNFHGYLDHLQGVSFRSYFHVIPPELQQGAMSRLPQDVLAGNLDEVYRVALQDVVGLEVELAQVVRDALQDDVPDPMVYTVSHFSTDQRKAVAAVWDDIGTLALARGNVTVAMNALRRSIHWFRPHHGAYIKMAMVLSTFRYLEDACECLQLLLDDQPSLLVQLRADFAFCPTLRSSEKLSMLHHPFTALMIQLGTLTVAFLLFVWWVQRRSFDDEPSSQTPQPATADKKQRKTLSRGRYLKQ